MSASVHRRDRWSSERPCPICGGSPADRQGQQTRCFGFLSPNGEWANCTREEQAGRLTTQNDGSTYGHKLKGECPCGKNHDGSHRAPPTPLRPEPKPIMSNQGAQEIIYSYADESGAVLFQVVRRGFGKGKKIFQRHPDGAGGWVNDLAGVRRVLYRLPELLVADPALPVYIVEGERDVETLRDWGLLATTNAMGAGHWTTEYSEMLRGRSVVILPDNDQPGEKHGDVVGASLAGIASAVRMVRLPGLASGGDISDWAAVGGTAQLLQVLREQAPLVAPLTPGDPFPLLSGAALRQMPAPEELIAGWVIKAPTAMIYARAGVGKTFLALDMALCIASGKPWHGHAVKHGPVLYIAAEGSYGIGKRYEAWCDAYNGGEDVPGFHLIPQPVFPTVAQTLDRLRATLDAANIVGLSAIFLDTLAQCFGDGDESDNHDSQVFLAGVIAVSQQTGATSVLIHHSGWDESRLRGASNFRNSVDSVLQIKADEADDRFIVRHDKIKDLEPAEPITFVRTRLGGSCYIAPLPGAQPANQDLNGAQHAILTMLATASFAGATSAELVAATGLPKSSFFRSMGELARGNMITSTGEKSGKDRRHTITRGGEKALERHENEAWDSRGTHVGLTPISAPNETVNDPSDEGESQPSPSRVPTPFQEKNTPESQPSPNRVPDGAAHRGVSPNRVPQSNPPPLGGLRGTGGAQPGRGFGPDGTQRF